VKTLMFLSGGELYHSPIVQSRRLTPLDIYPLIHSRELTYFFIKKETRRSLLN